MQNILNFILENKDIIIAIVGLIIYAISNWKEFEKRVTAGMLKAKDLAKDQILKSAKEQEDWVINNILIIVGKRFGFIVNKINEEYLRQIIHWLYVKAMDKYDDNKINGSFESK